MREFPIITSEQMSKVDDIAVEEGLLVMQMMENAALSITRGVQEYNFQEALILVGKGHNGGDGLAVARHLKNWGYDVKVLLAVHYEKLKELAQHHYRLIEKMGVTIELWEQLDKQKDYFNQTEIIIDALIGYNIRGNPREKYKDLIVAANKSNKKIVAVDIPSGLNGSTGLHNNPTIIADKTFTLALPKAGLLNETAKKYVGELYVADLGIPNFIYKKAGIDVPAGIFKEKSIVKFPIS